MTERTENLIRKHMREIVKEGNPYLFVQLLGEDLFSDVLRSMIDVAYEDIGYANYVADALNAHFPASLLENLPQIAKTLRERSLLEKLGAIILRVLNGHLDIQKVEDALDAL